VVPLLPVWLATWELEGHGPWFGVEPEDVLATGTIRRIQRVPIVYERQGDTRRYVATRELDRVDVTSTRERQRGHRVPGAGSHWDDDLLIHVELD